MKKKATTGLIAACFTYLSIVGCTGEHPDTGLPDSTSLGTPRGYKIVRTVTHFHSPYSHDACDKAGIQDGKLNEECLGHLRSALCKNKIDYLFLTDHPSNMVDYEMSELALIQGNDQPLVENGQVVGNKMSGCGEFFHPQISVGFESKLLVLGMTQHLETTPEARGTAYHTDDYALRNRLNTEANAIVAIPHTESKSLEWMKSINPDAIEVYNFHANMDPKIRKADLGLPAFQNMASLLTYLIDPFHELIPDFSFVNFLEVSSVYARKWNQLLSEGFKVAGIGGSDSHENVLPQKVSDGERLDSHRRISRIVTNHVLVSESNLQNVKSSLKSGRSWVVFESLGTPVGFDFYTEVAQQTYGVGETLALNGRDAQIVVNRPTLHAQSPQKGNLDPPIRIVLKRVESGTESIVASSTSQGILYSPATSGIYKVEVYIRPWHLRAFLGDFSKRADQEFLWMITNPIFLDP